MVSAVRFAVAFTLCAVVALANTTATHAASAVFAGDPVDATGRPYEILPGKPLVLPGPDGRLGTVDDVLDPAKVGDVDLVVRLGDVPAGAAIPDPAPARGGVAVATAGIRAAGTGLPFHVYLSDGAVTPATPYGHPLAAPDMDGLPVIVLVFADLDGDGFIGPTTSDPARQVRAIAELEPVGREVAFFAGSVANGSVTITVGGAASADGVRVVATALAFTGGYDPSVLGGFVPTGPGITTAQPFLPERDPARLFTPDIGPLAVNGTLNPRPRAAALPLPGSSLDLALRADGRDPTTDVAVALAGPAVCARLVEPVRRRGAVPAAPPELVLGTRGGLGAAKLRLVAVDRLGNPTDPPAGFAARIAADGGLAVAPDHDHVSASERVAIASAKGQTVKLRSVAAGAGTVRVTVGGARCQEIAFASRPERDRHGADAVVAVRGAHDFSTIASAVAGASDRNGDGRITIEVAEGIYREAVRVTRPLELRGAGAGRTVVDARGAGATLALASPAIVTSGLTVTGGTSGVAVESALTVRGLDSWANIGPGVQLAAAGAAAVACVARENGGAGFVVTSPATVSDGTSLDNAGAGIRVTAPNAVVTGNLVVTNAGDGIEVTGADATVTANDVAGNVGGGIVVEGTTGGVYTANRAAANDGTGLTLNQVTGALVDRNDCTTNGGFGMRIDRSSADFDAAAGVQAPAGSNDVADNRKGPLLIR